jgi:hypothetical protein
MTRKANIPLYVSIVGWVLLVTEEAAPLLYHVESKLPGRLFMLIVAGLLVLSMLAIVREIREVPQHITAALASAAQRATRELASQRGAGEPSTGDLAFGLGREFERNLNGTNGSHLRAVSDRQN